MLQRAITTLPKMLAWRLNMMGAMGKSAIFCQTIPGRCTCNMLARRGYTIAARGYSDHDILIIRQLSILTYYLLGGYRGFGE
jgi:hypothetical protein